MKKSAWDVILSDEFQRVLLDESPKGEQLRREMLEVITTESVDQETLRNCVLKCEEMRLIDYDLASAQIDFVTVLLFRPDAGDALLEECFQREIGWGALTHRVGPRWLLWKFAERHEREMGHVEPVWTLAALLYEDETVSPEEFKNFMERFWRILDLRDLRMYRSSHVEKETYLDELARRHQAERLKSKTVTRRGGGRKRPRRT